MGKDLEAWRIWFKEAGLAEAWKGKDFICAHGHHPYTRCDICVDMEPEEAKKLAEDTHKEGNKDADAKG